MDKNERRRKRYAEMPDCLKQEVLQRRREAYARKKTEGEELFMHDQAKFGDILNESTMTLETENSDAQSENSVTIDKNEERRKKYADMPQTMKEQLLKKRREAYASKKAKQKKGFTNYQSPFGKAMATYIRKRRNYLLTKNKKQLGNQTLVPQHQELEEPSRVCTSWPAWEQSTNNNPHRWI